MLVLIALYLETFDECHWLFWWKWEVLELYWWLGTSGLSSLTAISLAHLYWGTSGWDAMNTWKSLNSN